MSPLGKSLVFYFKYPAEMDRLYWQPRKTGVKPLTDGLDDGEAVLEMVQKVGDAACREVAAFLGECANRLDAHFQSVARAERVRRNIEERWGVAWRLWPRKGKSGPFSAGVYVDEGIRAFVPWIWCRGGRQAEDDTVLALGRGIKASACDFLQDRGTVALDRVEVSIPDGPRDFDVNREPLVDQVVEALSLDSAQVAALAKIARGRDSL